MTKIEIIDLILGKYIENPEERALEGGLIPRFITSDGKTDPIGFALLDPHQFSHIVGGIFHLVLHYRQINGWVGMRYFPRELLRERFRGHESVFWNDLQHFHDNNTYFTENGLSQNGFAALANLKVKWDTIKHPVYGDF